MIPNYLQDLFKAQAYDPNQFFLIAGPCVVEDEALVMEIGEKVSTICKNLGIPYDFKASYRKANRTSANSFTGIGDDTGMELIKKVGARFNVPTTSDIHAHEEAAIAAQFIDILQIPAFLCRQTDLLAAAAQTGKAVNIKKGQFMSGASMRFAVEKVLHENPEAVVYLTDRGNSFGYGDLVVDYRNLPEMSAMNVPVIMDCTHSLQRPNQTTGVTGGQPALIETIAKAAIAVGADGIFIETHPNPSVAKSDGANMLPLDQLEGLLEKLLRVREAIV